MSVTVADLPVKTTGGKHRWEGPLPVHAGRSGHLKCATCPAPSAFSKKQPANQPVREAVGTAVASHWEHDVAVIIPSTGEEYTLAAIVADWAAQNHVHDTPDGLAPGAYRSRVIGTLPDVAALQTLRTAGVFVMLYGPPGSGKTAMVNAAFPDAVTFCGDGDTTYDDLVGSWTPSSEHGRYVWADGPLVTAMREGRPFFFDDCALVSPKVAAALYPVLDGRAEITVKTHMVRSMDQAGDQSTGTTESMGYTAASPSWRPELVKSAPGFWVVGAWNPGTHGSVLSEAMASRFAVHIEIDTDYTVAKNMGLDRRLIKVAENMRSQQATGAGAGWVPQMRELLAFTATAELLGEDAAVGNLLGQCPREDRPELTKILSASFGAKPEVLAAGAGVTS